MAITPQVPTPNLPQPPIPLVANAAAHAAQNPPAPRLQDGAQNPAQALVPVLGESDTEPTVNELEVTGPLALLPIELDVAIPVREFRVRQLLALEPGQLIETQWHNGDDVPLAAGEVQLAWSEFEVIETELAVRITRLP